MAGTQRTVAEPLPDDLESSQAKLVYLYLDTNGAASVEDLRDHLGLRLITLFSVLRTLGKEGMVEERGDRYRAV